MINPAYKLNNFAIEIDQKLRIETFNKGQCYENKYLKLCNNICPLCKFRIPQSFSKTLKKVGVVGMVAVEEENLCLSYALCKRCSKNLFNAMQQEKLQYEQLITKHIFSIL